MKKGDIVSFDNNWKTRKETHYNHWTNGQPVNQIQFAFYNHWLTFKSIIENSKKFNGGKKVLEVGAGRGSLSAFFSQNGYSTTLLDSSKEILKIAKTIFDKNQLKAEYILGDANAIEFGDETFDIVFSIGLLEHFDDVSKPISEQLRVLSKGGIWIGYIVPIMENIVQKEYNWINDILKSFQDKDKNEIPKDPVYRTSYGSDHYRKVLEKLKLKDINVSGIYSVPMVSHSVDFPFSLMNQEAEKRLVKRFNEIFKQRKILGFSNPWLCEESYGNALLVWGTK